MITGRKNIILVKDDVYLFLDKIKV